VAEATIWCLFWWERDQLVAPPLELGILPGVSRMRLAELTAIGERRAGREALDGKAVFLANAARGVTPVTLLDGRPVPVHPQTSELARRFWP
jgi:branched-subunit amino acid aminotransferase/4-amino-4-deoxychorismate lyase